jgi:hypothetical protein
MCAIIEDQAEVSVERCRRARKAHRCLECARAINPGERYRRWATLYDGCWDSAATCAHCCEMLRWLTVICHGQYYSGDAIEEVERHVDDVDWMAASDPLHWDEERVDQLVGSVRAWSGPGAVVARVVRHADADWAGLSVDDVRELTQQAIDAWQTACGEG